MCTTSVTLGYNWHDAEESERVIHLEAINVPEYEEKL